MSEINIDLLRKDECEPLTQAQMNDIKSQFHPSNTANVNIVPYHIYDADEHTVGEWRETIDGVKKKKPVYEKNYTFNGDFANDATLGTFSNYANVRIIGYNGSCLSLNGDSYSPLVFGHSNMGEWAVGVNINIKNGSILLYRGTSQRVKQVNLTVTYIKTSDSWEEV